jgi:hypothetical protein
VSCILQLRLIPVNNISEWTYFVKKYFDLREWIAKKMRSCSPGEHSAGKLLSFNVPALR